MIIHKLINDSSYIRTEELSMILKDPSFDKLPTPIVFRAACSGITELGWFVIAHGLPGKPEFFDSVTELRVWINNHTDIAVEETINLISCYSGTFNRKEVKDNRFNLIESYYPIITPYDYFRGDIIPVAIIQDDKEADDVILEFTMYYASIQLPGVSWDNISQEKKDRALTKMSEYFMRGRRYMEALAK